MRVLTLDEIELVAGGAVTSVSVSAIAPPTFIPNDPAPSNGPGGAGSGGSSGGTGSGTYSPGDAVSHLSNELGVDLSNYANHSPTLMSKLTDLANQGWHIKFHTGSSETSYKDSTIYINENYRNNLNQVTQQLSHELGHFSYAVLDSPTIVTRDVYVQDKLRGEGAAAFVNAAVERELLNSLHIDIGMASYNPGITTPLYSGEYQQFLNNPTAENYMNVISAMGNTYGAYEHTMQNGVDETYRQHYENEYNNTPGHR